MSPGSDKHDTVQRQGRPCGGMKADIFNDWPKQYLINVAVKSFVAALGYVSRSMSAL